MDRKEMKKAFEAKFPEAWAYWNDVDSFLPPYELAWQAWQAAMAHSCEGKAELAQMLRELANTARGSVEFDDWPELQASIANAESALSRHRG